MIEYISLNDIRKLTDAHNVITKTFKKEYELMEHRNRSSGWIHAKRSGHQNEKLVKDLLDYDEVYTKNFLRRIGCRNKQIVSTSIGGLCETNVESVIPNTRKTKSKTDLKIFYTDGTQTNISIKKSLSGQVYFVRAGLFIECFERQFDKRIPLNVRRAIQLFWAEAEDSVEIIERYGDLSNIKDYNLQLHHKSLNATTLYNYNETLFNELLNWFKNNAYELAFLSFASGAVLDSNEWSDFVWYKNMLEENEIDYLFYIKDICKACESVADDETYYGKSNGGTTIQLPFGFVQWHQAQLQFHHNCEKLINLVDSR